MLPIGATRPTPVSIRVIATTYCNLEALVRERRFRDDLYYRLNDAHLTTWGPASADAYSSEHTPEEFGLRPDKGLIRR